jgi:hypothetical protein
MTGALAKIPDSRILTKLSADAQGQCAASTEAHAKLDAGDPQSPLAPASAAFASVHSSAQINLPGLGDSLGSVLRTVTGAVPPSVVEQVEAIGVAMREAEATLARNPILQVLPPDRDLRDVVEQIVAEAIQLFERRLTELAERLIPADDLDSIVTTLRLIDDLRTDPDGHADELVRFLAQTLFGFPVDVLMPGKAHVDAVGHVVVTLDEDDLQATTRALRGAVDVAVDEVARAVSAFDPTSPAAYTQLVGRIKAVAAAVRDARDTLVQLYHGVEEKVIAFGWGDVVPGYVAIVHEIELKPRELVGDVVDSTLDLLDDLLNRVTAAVDDDELVSLIDRLGDQLAGALASSALGQAHEDLLGFLDGVRETIAGIPLAQVRTAVLDMADRVGAELEELGLDGLATTIEEGFDELQTTATTAVGRAGTAVRSALGELLGEFDKIDGAGLVASLKDAIDDLDDMIGDLRNDASGVIDDIEAQLDSLEQLTFKPVSDQVIGEIDELRQRLSAMNPDALSDEAKLAIRAALAVLEAIDVEDKVVKLLHDGFGELHRAVREVLDDIASGMEQIRESMGELRPETVLEPLTTVLSEISRQVGSLDAALLTGPLRVELGKVEATLARLDPGSILRPLEAPYAEALSLVRRLDPQSWGSQLVALHGELEALVARMDLSPLFGELDQRRRDLFVAARDSVSIAIHEVDLPDPLAEWLARIWSLVGAISDLVLIDPEIAMRDISARIHETLTPAALYEPLEVIFEDVVATLASLPADDLVAAATALRDDLVDVLDQIEPARLLARLRAAHRRLVEASAAMVVPTARAVRDLKASFHAKVSSGGSLPGGVVSVVVEFDALVSLLDTGQADSLVVTMTNAHDRVLRVLSEALDHLDVREAQAAFDELRSELVSLVPPALASPGPLTVDAVLDAVETWRPSVRATTIDDSLQTLMSRLGPVADQLEEALVRFGAHLRTAVDLVDPLALDQPVAAIFDAMREQVEQLHPAEALETLHEEVYLPVLHAVEGVDPAVMAKRLNGAYASVRTAVMHELDTLVGEVERALTAHLAAVRKAADDVIREVEDAARTATAGLQEVVQRASDLVFVGLVERLRVVLDNLSRSFDVELERIRKAFDAMLDAAPLGHRIHPRTGGAT